MRQLLIKIDVTTYNVKYGTRSVDTRGVQECLQAFYAIITTEDDSFAKPSCALLHVVDKIPDVLLGSATRAMLEDSGQPQFEAKTVVGLQNLIEWTTQLPSPPIAARWVMEMLRGLQARQTPKLIDSTRCDRDSCPVTLRDRLRLIDFK